MKLLGPEVGAWYKDLQTGDEFEVVAWDPDKLLVETQHIDGEPSGGQLIGHARPGLSGLRRLLADELLQLLLVAHVICPLPERAQVVDGARPLLCGRVLGEDAICIITVKRQRPRRRDAESQAARTQE